MNMQRRIITFGLTEAQNALVEQSRPAGNYEVFDTDAPTDVIAIGAVAIIVFAPAMDEDSIGMIFGNTAQMQRYALPDSHFVESNRITPYFCSQKRTNSSRQTGSVSQNQIC